MANTVWTQQDYVIGRCSREQVDHPREVTHEEAVAFMKEGSEQIHPLLEGLDPLHPDTDRMILRRLYHSDPQAFLSAYGSSGINKLMDIAVKEGSQASHPAITNCNAWSRLMADVAKTVASADSLGGIAAPAVILALCHEAGGSLSALRRALTEHDLAG